MTLVVENGSGLVNADSYLSVAEADTYHANHGNPSAWADVKATGILRISIQPTAPIQAQGCLTLDVNPTGEVASQGSLTVDTNPSDGDTMTIDGKVYTFQTVLIDSDGNIEIGATLGDTQTNIENAINLTGTPGVGYALSTSIHPTVSIGPFSTDVAILTAKIPGTAGNAIATVETFTAGTNIFDAPTLGTTTFGVDSDTLTIDSKTYKFQDTLTDVDGSVQIGATVSDTQNNLVNAINLTGIPGVEYALSTTIHPTVTIASFVTNVAVITATTIGAAGNLISTTETFIAPTNVFDASTLGTTRLGVDGATFTIGLKQYVFQDTLTDSDGNILIGADVATTRDSVLASINGDTSNAGVASSTIAHPDVEALSISGDDINLSALVGGIAGNSITLAETFVDPTNLFTETTLLGGEDQKEEALRLATQYLDLQYNSRWLGRRTEEDQALDWPRVGAIDQDGFTVGFDEVPSRVKDATAEMALRSITEDLLPDLENQGEIKRQKVKVGPVEEDITYAGASLPIKKYRKVDLLLAELLFCPGQVRRA